MKKSGLAFHCHHDALLEYVYNYDERVKFIKKNKPKEEQELRLCLFQMIPDDKLPQTGWDAYNKAGDAYNKARDADNKARDDYYKANKKEIEKLHNELCPDCPFENDTIFSRKDKDGKWY